MGTVVSQVVSNPNGRIEFVGLWRDSGSRAMPIKMGVAPHDPNQVRRAFDTLVGEMRRAGVTSGILAAQSYNQMHWSANPNESGYKRHGFIGDRPEQATRSSWSQRTHQHEGLRFEGFDGVMDILGGDWQNAVYRVSLPGGAAGVQAQAMEREAPAMECDPSRGFDAYRTGGCYFGSCILPVIWTTFKITPTGPDSANATGCSFCLNVIPIPWSISLNREGERRLRGLINPADPNSHAIFDFNHAGNCYCQKGGNGEAVAWGVQLCGASSCCTPCCHQNAGGRGGDPSTVTSHDMKGTWVICAPPCGWGIYNAKPHNGDPNKYHEQGCCFLCMALPVPTDEVWNRAPNTNSFHKDKNPADVVNFCCAGYGNEKLFIHKCKVCPG